MARSIEEIKRQITDSFISDETVIEKYSLKRGRSFTDEFSPVSLESILFYVFASACWVVEKLFDRHASEVQRRIDEMTPHTLKWYARKAKAFRRGISLAKDSDRYPDIYNTKEWDDTLIVKYAVATESHTVIYLKVATADNDGMPMPMAQEDMYELKRYFAEIKDAGVALEVINQPADMLSLSIDIFVSHSAFNSETMADEELDKRIRRTISSVVADLPFDGVLRESDIVSHVEAIEKVKVCDITSMKSKASGENGFSAVNGYARPKAGYFKTDNINITYKKYMQYENQ